MELKEVKPLTLDIFDHSDKEILWEEDNYDNDIYLGSKGILKMHNGDYFYYVYHSNSNQYTGRSKQIKIDKELVDYALSKTVDYNGDKCVYPPITIGLSFGMINMGVAF